MVSHIKIYEKKKEKKKSLFFKNIKSQNNGATQNIRNVKIIFNNILHILTINKLYIYM